MPEYLPYERFEELYIHARDADLWEPERRRLLFFRIERILPAVPKQLSPQSQLRQDLIYLNAMPERGGVPPLRIWIENARTESAGSAQQDYFEHLLQDLHGESSPISAPAFLPQQFVNEAILWQDDMLPVGYLETGMRCSSSVARMQIFEYRDGVRTARYFWGTAWIVASGLLITAHHVFNARGDGEHPASTNDLQLQALNAVVQFDVDAADVGGEPLSVAALIHEDAQLDYALFELQSPPPKSPLKVNWSPFVLKPEEHAPLNIIQHPSGGSKKIAIRNNLAALAPSPELQYFTATLGGSSGAPVFNDTWEVVALHRASKSTAVRSFQGKKTAIINLGVQMAAIHSSLPDEILARL